MKNFLFILIGITGVLGTFLSTLSEHKLNTNQPGSSRSFIYKSVLFLRKTWVKVFVILITTALVLYITLVRDKIVENDAKIEQDKRDSLTRRKYQEDREKSDRTIASVLAGNYLRLDTAQKKIVSMIQDSVNKKVKIDINRIIQPLIGVDVTSDTLKGVLNLKVEIFTSGGNAQNIKLLTSIASIEKNRLNIIYLNDEAFASQPILPLTSRVTKIFGIDKYKFADAFAVSIKGTYEDQDSRSYPLELIYTYDVTRKWLQPPSPGNLGKYREFFATGKSIRL